MVRGNRLAGFLDRELGYRPSWWIWALFAPAMTLFLLDLFDVSGLEALGVGLMLALVPLILYDRSRRGLDAEGEERHG